MIQQTRFLDGTYAGIIREINKDRIPSDKILYQNGITGYMTSFAARDRLDIIDEKAVMKCWNEAQDHLRRETWGKDKDYLRTKINLKNRIMSSLKRNTGENTVNKIIGDIFCENV
ncbi:MAG: hypothetical protein E3K32_11570 [wastewater metagenome]|nr:hypothetical protein [Candidatus Loosdrechtia aerotolerans]